MLGTLGGWIPPATVTNHAGEPLTPDRAFFVAPPLEIGTLQTAYSEVLSHKEPNTKAVRIGCTIGGAIFGAVLVWLALYSVSKISPTDYLFGAAGGALFGFVIGLAVKSNEQCNYVGERGIARYKYNSDPIKAQAGDVFLFDNAVELRTKITRHYVNGAYSGTPYAFTWTDATGKKVFALTGQHNGNKNLPPAKDPFHFALSAELAWSNHWLKLADMEWKRAGAVRFNLYGGDFIQLRQGWIEITQSGKTHRCNTDDIGYFNLDQGVVQLKTKDARVGFFGLGSSGIYKFPYHELGNGKLFLLLLSRLVMEEKGSILE